MHIFFVYCFLYECDLVLATTKASSCFVLLVANGRAFPSKIKKWLLDMDGTQKPCDAYLCNAHDGVRG